MKLYNIMSFVELWTLYSCSASNSYKYIKYAILCFFPLLLLCLYPVCVKFSRLPFHEEILQYLAIIKKIRNYVAVQHSFHISNDPLLYFINAYFLNVILRYSLEHYDFYVISSVVCYYATKIITFWFVVDLMDVCVVQRINAANKTSEDWVRIPVKFDTFTYEKKKKCSRSSGLNSKTCIWINTFFILEKNC